MARAFAFGRIDTCRNYQAATYTPRLLILFQIINHFDLLDTFILLCI